MLLPFERALREERAAVVATMTSLTDEEFESAPTLCEEWAPRDILGHLLGVDSAVTTYLRTGLRINAANARIVEDARRLTRAQLLGRARRWAAQPALTSRLAAYTMLGDVAMHHQDVLRPLGRSRDIPEASRNAILREGFILGRRRLLSHRVEPTDGGMSLGRGRVVRGTSEALGLWLAGRRGVEEELEFAPA